MRALNYAQPHSLRQLIGGLTAGRAGRKGSGPSEDSLPYYPVCVVASGRILGILIMGHFSIGTLSNRDERYEVELTIDVIDENENRSYR